MTKRKREFLIAKDLDILARETLENEVNARMSPLYDAKELINISLSKNL